MVSITEFRYYNTKYEIIKDSILKKVENKLLNEGKNSKYYYCNKELYDNNICLVFEWQSRWEKRTQKEFPGLKYIKPKDLGLTIKQCNKLKDSSNYNKKIYFGCELVDNEKYFVKRTDLNILEKNFFDTFIEYKETVLLNVYDNKNYKNFNEEYFDDMKPIYETLTNNKTLFENIYDEDYYKKEYKIDATFSRNIDQYIIINVIEHRLDEKNFRFVLAYELNDTYRRDFKILIVPDSSEYYNFLDEKRIFTSYKNSLYFLELQHTIKNQIGEYLIYDNVVQYILENKNKLLPPNSKIIDFNTFEFYKNKFKHNQTHSNENPIMDKLLDKYKEKLKENKTIKIEHVKLSKNHLELLNGDFKIEFTENFIDIIDNFYDIRNIILKEDIRYNFNQFFEELINLSNCQYFSQNYIGKTKLTNFKTVKFKFNDINVKIERNGTRMYINDVFTRIEDGIHLLSNVVCCNTQEDYERYLKDVSYIGIEYKKYIANGIYLHLNNECESLFRTFNDEYKAVICQLRLSLLWDSKKKNTIYVYINDQKYRIKNKVKFRKHFFYEKRYININTLKENLNESIEGLNDDNFFNVIDDAIEESKKVIEKAQQFVKLTVKDINAEKGELELQSNKINGYYVTGLHSKSKYFINDKTLDVYKFMDGQWNRRCVVDGNSTSRGRIFEDRLANRLINIYNEPKRIYTIQ